MPPKLTPRRLLAVKLADLGDLVLVTPALQALRAAHPKAKVDLLTSPSSAHLLRGAPYLDDILTLDKFAFDGARDLVNPRKLVATLHFFRELRAARYDTLVLFHHFATRQGAVKYGLLCIASGARVRVGLDNGRGRFLTHRVPNRGFGARHEADYWLEVVALLGADPDLGWGLHLPIEAKDHASAAQITGELRRGHAGRVVAMHTGAGAYSLARIWPLERFAEVARGMLRDGAAIIVLGGPDDKERAARLVEMVHSSGMEGQMLNLAGRTGIHETAAILEACDLFVGNDSGPMHLAAAMNTPVVAIFGPSNAQAWGPYAPRGQSNPHTTVSLGLPCQPCFYRGYSVGLREGCGPRPCLTRLEHEQVLVACRRVLGSLTT